MVLEFFQFIGIVHFILCVWYMQLMQAQICPGSDSSSYCYHKDLDTLSDEYNYYRLTERLRSTVEVDTWYNITYNTLDNGCYDPSISIHYAPHDYNPYFDFLSIYSKYNNIETQLRDNCIEYYPYSWLTQCHELRPCLDSMSIIDDFIPPLSWFQINIHKGSGIDNYKCGESLNVNISIHCGKTPEPTAAPTTPSPTFMPTYISPNVLQWNELQNIKLPYPMFDHITAFYNDTIFILGGYVEANQIDENNLTLYADFTLATNENNAILSPSGNLEWKNVSLGLAKDGGSDITLRCSNQCWLQLEHLLFLEIDFCTFLVYDLSLLSFVKKYYFDRDDELRHLDHNCVGSSLATNQTHIFMFQVASPILIYDIYKESFSESSSSMPGTTSISFHPSALPSTDYTKIYVFGVDYDTDYEAIYVYDILNDTFVALSNEQLTTGLTYPRAVRSDDDNYMYVVSGQFDALWQVFYGMIFDASSGHSINCTIALNPEIIESGLFFHPNTQSIIAFGGRGENRRAKSDAFYYIQVDATIDFVFPSTLYLGNNIQITHSFINYDCYPHDEIYYFVLSSNAKHMDSNWTILIRNSTQCFICDESYGDCAECDVGFAPLITQYGLVDGHIQINLESNNSMLTSAMFVIDVLCGLSLNVSSQVFIPGDYIFFDLEWICPSSPSNNTMHSIQIINTDLAINDILRVSENGDCFICTTSNDCTVCDNGLLPAIPSTSTIINDTFVISVIPSDSDSSWLLTGDIVLQTLGCDSGKGLLSDTWIMDCTECPQNQFTFSSGFSECIHCDETNVGLSCEGSNEVIVEYNYFVYGYSLLHDEFISFYDVNNEDIIYSSICPPNFCCRSTTGCNFFAEYIIWISNEFSNQKDDGSLCAKGRNYTSLLCGECEDGLYELFGTTQCGACDDYDDMVWLLVPFVCCLLFVLFLVFIDAKPPSTTKSDVETMKMNHTLNVKKLLIDDDSKALQMMLLKVMMYYYQSLAQVLSSRGLVTYLSPLLSVFNLSFDISTSNNSESGYCIIPYLSSMNEIIVSSITIPIFLMLNISIISLIRCQCVTVAFLSVSLISIGAVLSLCFKLLTCITLSDHKIVHFYEGNVDCFSGYWITALLVICVVIIPFFATIFIKIYKQSSVVRQSGDNVYRKFVKSYTKQYWFWEYVILLRRVFIALFTAVQYVGIKQNSSYISLTLAIVLFVFTLMQTGYTPFIYSRVNRLETICLCCLFASFIAIHFISLQNDEFLSIFIGICILIPLLIFFYYIFKMVLCCGSYKKLNTKDVKVQKMLQRIPESNMNSAQKHTKIDQDDNDSGTSNDSLEAVVNDTSKRFISTTYTNDDIELEAVYKQ
eukprot:690323_1